MCMECQKMRSAINKEKEKKKKQSKGMRRTKVRGEGWGEFLNRAVRSDLIKKVREI